MLDTRAKLILGLALVHATIGQGDVVHHELIRSALDRSPPAVGPVGTTRATA